MKKNALGILVFTILLGASAFAGTFTLPITNPDFLGPVCGGGYAYTGSGGCGAAPPQQDLSGTGWTFANGSGLASGGSGFNLPTGFVGQAAFLQGSQASVSQTLVGLSVGQTYDLSFLLGSRFNDGCCNGDQTIEVLVNSGVLGTYYLSSYTAFALQNLSFTATGTQETLQFLGLGTGDNTAFVTDVGVTYTTPEPVSLILFGTGLAGIGGFVRRRLVG
jgi:hypothetical protein